MKNKESEKKGHKYMKRKERTRTRKDAVMKSRLFLHLFLLPCHPNQRSERTQSREREKSSKNKTKT